MQNSQQIQADARYEVLSVDGVRLRVFTWNLDASGVPLVICNGLGQSIEILLPLILELPGRPIIAFDAAGVGRSDVPETITTIAEHAAMLRQILDQLEIRRFDVMGISWGGAVAQQIAHDLPKRVRRLVLAITSAGGPGSWWGSPIALSEIIFPWRYLNKGYGNIIGPFMYGGEAILEPRLFREYVKDAIRPNLRGYFAQVAALCSWSSISWLGQLVQPTLIIGGAFDALIPIPNQIFLAFLKPMSDLRVFNAGHLVMYSHRSEVGELITEFLDNSDA